MFKADKQGIILWQNATQKHRNWNTRLIFFISNHRFDPILVHVKPFSVTNRHVLDWEHGLRMWLRSVISQWCEQLVKVWLSTESQLKFSYVRISAGRRYVHEIAIKSFMKGKSTNFQCKLDCPKNNLTLCLETKPTLQYYTGLSDETVWFGKHTVASALSRQARFVSEIQIFLQLHGLLSFPK